MTLTQLTHWQLVRTWDRLEDRIGDRPVTDLPPGLVRSAHAVAAEYRRRVQQQPSGRSDLTLSLTMGA